MHKQQDTILQQNGVDMSNLEYKLFYERNLPHYQPPGATLFVTFRLANSLPAHTIRLLGEEANRIEAILTKIADSDGRARKAYEEQRRYFGKWDKALDIAQSGPFWLRVSRIAALVLESLHRLDDQKYTLEAACIMPNHVHIVFTPLLKDNSDDYHSLASIMHSLKRYTSREANKILWRT
jgi:hypothetical protein